jgi:PAS domain S-box-containing protein
VRPLRNYIALDRRASAWAGIVALAAAGLGMFGEAFYAARLIEAERARLTLAVIGTANEFETAVQRDLAALSALAGHVTTLSAQHPPDAPAFATAIGASLPRFHAASIQARLITVAPEGVVRFIYPRFGNEAALHRNLVNDPRPDVRAALARAIATRAQVVNGFNPVAEGGYALAARQPIFHGDRFWGVVGMLLDVSALARASGVDHIEQDNDVAFRAASGAVVFGSPDLFDAAGAVVQTIYLSDGQWLLGALPRGGWRAYADRQITDARIGAAAVALLVVLLVYLVVRRHAWLAREVAERTEMLALSQARFRDFAQASADWYWEQDEALRFTHVSASGGVKAWGVERNAIGKTRREAVGQGASAEQWAQHEADLQARRPFRDFRVSVADAQGCMRQVSVSGVPVFDAAGAFKGYRGTGTDITARAAAERLADEARRRLAESIDALSDGFVLWDAQDRMVMCNSAFQRCFNDAEWLVPGISYAEFCRRGFAVNPIAGVSEGDVESWLARRLEAHRDPSAPIEMHLAGDRCVVVHESRMAGGDTVGLYTDTTELHRARADLKSAHERYELAAKQAGIWDWDLIEKQVHYSPRFIELLGYDADEFSQVVCDSIMAILHPDDVADYLAALDDHISNPAQPYRSEHRFLTKDRGYRWFLARGQSRRDAAGRPVRMAGLLTDIDERRRMQDELRHAKEAAESASRVKSAFLASMSHELRTPLNAVIGFAEIMATEVLGPIGSPRYAAYAKDILASGQHLLAVINDVLDLSKIEAGHAELREDMFDIAAETAAAMRLVEVRARNAGVSLALVEPEIAPVLKGDAVRIKQVLLNLLSNAVKFTPEGGAVTVAIAQRESGDATVCVADTGIGMSAAEIEIALQPFRQIDNVHTRRHDGTGLGLPLAKAFVEMHGGRLEIESAQGVGTKITIVLPASRVIAIEAEQVAA